MSFRTYTVGVGGERGPKYTKDPADVLDYILNYASEDGTNDGSDSDDGFLQGDTISTSTWSIETGLTEDSESETTKTATVWLSGGTDGDTYKATNTIVTAGGRTKVMAITIKVRAQ